MSTENLHSTPLANRRHIALYGSTNAGKSTLFNALLGQDMSIVSDRHGTTTDPVIKTMELIGYGPIALIDTAGLNDTSELGQARIARSRKQLDRSDAAIYLADAAVWITPENEQERQSYQSLCREFDRYGIPHLLVFSKSDMLDDNQVETLNVEFPEAIVISLLNPYATEHLYSKLVQLLRQADGDLHASAVNPRSIAMQTRNSPNPDSNSLIAHLTDPGQTVLLVIPIDSEAPKGRLILPQVQLIRDCLDQGIRCLICRETELARTITDHRSGGIDLVVTDSQAFGLVASIVPDEISLTSFSMLLAFHKGDFSTMLAGLSVIDHLADDDRVLISEACTHNSSHEDIGRVKLPAMLTKRTGARLNFVHCAGQSYPDDLASYRLIVHCGGCMITDRTMRTRIRLAQEQGTAITNYGLLLAYGNGILERSIEPFRTRHLI